MPVLIVNPLEWSLTFENSIFPSDAGDWIAEGMQLQTGEYSTWHPQQEEAPSDWVNYPAVIIAGSLSSAYDKDAWIMEFIRQNPLLGGNRNLSFGDLFWSSVDSGSAGRQGNLQSQRLGTGQL